MIGCPSIKTPVHGRLYHNEYRRCIAADASYSRGPVVRESRFLPPDTVGSIWQRSCLIRGEDCQTARDAQSCGPNRVRLCPGAINSCSMSASISEGCVLSI